MTLTFIDFFAGIGGFHSGMELAGHKCVGWVEWDKFARKSYEAMYDTKGLFTANDISKIKDGGVLPSADVWCFGSPCTNISLAGNRQGIHGEASSMFFEVMRLLNDRQEVRKPAYLFMENVKNLLSSNGGRDFAEVLLQMGQAGYDVEWQVCNSKEVVPQNRERIFVIGHKRGRITRRIFPLDIKPYATEYRFLSDVLENNVDEKFYLSESKVKQLVINANKHSVSGQGQDAINVVGSTKYDWQTTSGQCERVYGDGKSPTLTATDYKHPNRIAEVNGKLVKRADQVKQIGNMVKTNSFGGNPQRGWVYDDRGLAPTLNTMQGGGLEPKVLIKNATKRGYSETNTLTANSNQGVIDKREVFPCLTPDRLNKRQNGRRFKGNEEPMFTLTAADRHGVAIKRKLVAKPQFSRLGRQAVNTFNEHHDEVYFGDCIESRNKRLHHDKTSTLTTRPDELKTAILPVTQELRIRKLTPLECWRLQGFTDEQFYKAQNAGISNSQLYKQAGNAVTVPVIHAIAVRFEVVD